MFAGTLLMREISARSSCFGIDFCESMVRAMSLRNVQGFVIFDGVVKYRETHSVEGISLRYCPFCGKRISGAERRGAGLLRKAGRR